jgi:UDP-N-acetylglucosamine 2-epimerase (non-hydrolysing)
MLRLMSIVGTRPEAIKMAPVIRQVRDAPWCHSIVVATAQHRDLLDQVLDRFGIRVDVDLDIMTPGQTLARLTALLTERLDAVVEAQRPDMIIAQGDTTSVLVAALIAFYRRIPFAHVEAGLRTGNLENPFPEEFNRYATGRIAALHFAPSEAARRALLREGVAAEKIFVTGNTVVDALLETVATRPAMPMTIAPDRKVVLFTAHRRENFGEPMRRIFRAVRALADRYENLSIVYPVHPNPEVRGMAEEMLAGHPGICLTDPLGYAELVAVLDRAAFVLTDSGGLQEEGSILGKPTLVLREDTERTEVIEAGVGRLVGSDADRIVAEASRLMEDPAAYAAMARRVPLYGDGRAGERIAAILRRHALGSSAEPATSLEWSAGDATL